MSWSSTRQEISCLRDFKFVFIFPTVLPLFPRISLQLLTEFAKERSSVGCYSRFFLSSASLIRFDSIEILDLASVDAVSAQRACRADLTCRKLPGQAPHSLTAGQIDGSQALSIGAAPACCMCAVLGSIRSIARDYCLLSLLVSIPC
jgi:hypothetical protein